MRYTQNRISLVSRCRSRKRQQGVIVIVALFLVALVATMAYAMMSRLERDIRRTTLLLRNAQVELYAQGSIHWAIEQLRNDLIEKKQNQLTDNIPIKSPVQNENGYRIFSTIYDMQARFNLNNLKNLEAQAGFKRLLQWADPKMPEAKTRDLMLAIVDWIKPSTQQSEYDKYYLTLPMPYRAAHRAMMSASELRLVKGMTANLFAILQPYITALPGVTPINVQTALAPVFMTLNQTMTIQTANAIVDARAKSPLISTEQFLNLNVMKNQKIQPDSITLESSYFLVETEVTIEQQSIVFYTLLERALVNNKVTVTKLRQSKSAV